MDPGSQSAKNTISDQNSAINGFFYNPWGVSLVTDTLTQDTGNRTQDTENRTQETEHRK